MLITLIKTNPERLHDLITGTPAWTWGIFAGLVYLGASQLRPRITTTRQAWSISMALAGLGLAGLLFSFRASPLLAGASGIWIAVALTTMYGLSRFGVGIRAAESAMAVRPNEVEIDGSVVPLALMMFAFGTRYVAGLELAVNPSALQDSTFVVVTSAVSGLVSGAFLARARATGAAIRSRTAHSRSTTTLERVIS